MLNQYSLPVVHPAFELLKRSARILHFIAASIILANAVFELKAADTNQMLCYLQMFIAADIYVLILFGGPILQEAPRVNLLFRLIETLAILGVAIMLYADNYFFTSMIHFLLSAGYGFLFYREWRVMHSEQIQIRHTGITLPSFLRDEEIGWPDVKKVVPKYHSIIIETLRNKKISFQLRENLRIEDLEQIDEYCGQHLIVSD